MPRPPRLARRLLRRLPEPTRSWLEGDLEERFQDLAENRPRYARLWYWRQVLLALVAPLPGPGGVPHSPLAGPRNLVRDLGHALRSLRRRPLETLATALPLALGIGAVATAFSILWGTLLTGLPFEEANRLVHFERARPAEGDFSLPVAPHDYRAWQDAQRSFEGLGAYVEREIALPGGEGAPPDRLVGVAISANSFPLLRVDAAVGRTFTPEDEAAGAAPVLLLSHDTWTGRFGADPGVVGRTVATNEGLRTVVGVMPRGFGFPIAEEFWVPLHLDLAGTPRGQGRLDVFGRLQPGVSLEAARGEFEGITGRLARDWADTHEGVTASLRTFQEEYVGEEFTRTVHRLLVGAGLVLLVACANAANLLLMRGLRRRHDLAVRTALGATRGTLLRLLLLEAGLLSLTAAVGGVALAAAGVAWFNRVGTGSGVFALPHGPDSLFWWQVSLDGPTLLAILGVVLVSTLLAGLAPAFASVEREGLRTRGASARGRGGQRGGGLQRAMVWGQLALTVGLLVAAGFVVRSGENVSRVAAELVPDDVLVLALSLPSSSEADARYGSLDRQRAFLDELTRRLNADPAVERATFAGWIPLDRPVPTPVRVEGPESDRPVDAGVVTTSPAFFEIFRIQPVQGRALDDRDHAGSVPVAVVTRSFAERHLDGGAVGRLLRLGEETDEPWVEVVGVIPDQWERPGRPEEQAGVYLPLSQVGLGDPGARLGRWGLAYPTVAIHLADPEAAGAAWVGGHLAALDPTLPIRRLESMEERAAQRLGRYRVWGQFWTTFAAVALFLAGLGIYGVLGSQVARRTREIGVRRALGASASDVRRSVLGRGLVDVAAGLAAGLGLGVVLARALNHLLYGVALNDPTVFLAVGGLVAVVGLAASWIPAARAARIPPGAAIRDG